MGTHLRRSADGVNWDDLVLSTAPASVPAKTFDPYLVTTTTSSP